MREAALNTSSFPTARCEACDRHVLTYLAFNDQDEEQRLCVHCDALIESELHWVTAAELEEEGYSVGAAPTRSAGAGCGSGGGACGTCSVRRWSAAPATLAEGKRSRV